MKRINEKTSAIAFVKRVNSEFYKYERSINNEVVYKDEKEERDTNAIKEFVNTNAFLKLKEMI